jgi:large-conductance mechanosensitive channel
VVDDSPRSFLSELKSGILKKRIGQIALAVVLAEGCIRFLGAIVWLLVMPAISELMSGSSESVLFRTKPVFRWEQLFGSFLEFAATVIFVFYANRWIRGAVPDTAAVMPEKSEVGVEPAFYYDLTGKPLNPTEQGPEK